MFFRRNADLERLTEVKLPDYVKEAISGTAAEIYWNDSLERFAHAYINEVELRNISQGLDNIVQKCNGSVKTMRRGDVEKNIVSYLQEKGLPEFSYRRISEY